MLSENSIEFITNNQTATATISQGRFLSRIMRLAETHSDCEIIAIPENNGGYLVAHFPVAWIRINPPREISESERSRMAEVARKNFNKDTTGRRK